MKKFKNIFILFISLMLLTGCNKNSYNYEGDELIYELDNNAIADINSNGAKIIVEHNQAFVEILKKDYSTYSRGEHNIKKKKQSYQYYFISLKKIRDIRYGTSDPIKLNDEKYGELNLNSHGNYDYEISNINKFIASYLNDSKESTVDIYSYVEDSVLNTLIDEIVNADVVYTDLPYYSNTIKENVIKRLEEKGISCFNFEIQDIGLTEESAKLVKKIDTNNSMFESFINNVTWINSDNSELKFFKTDFKWYQVQGEYDDNYQFGNYKFYIDDLAVEYITEDLKSFGVTLSELQKLFDSDEEFDKSNFVVFEIDLVGYKIGGQETVVNQPIYWYGFLLKNNQNLQVVNMTTATYYNFTKKSV